MVLRRILLIDDELDIQMVVKATLELVGGMQVSVAPSGLAGVQKAEIELPDAILLDMMLPDMDGATTLKRLLENSNTQHIPVVFLTAKVQDNEQQRLIDLGATGVIAKPFDPATLAERVSKALGWTS